MRVCHLSRTYFSRGRLLLFERFFFFCLDFDRGLAPSSRSESEAGGHNRPLVDDSADARRPLQPRSGTSDKRTSAGPTFTTSPAIDAGTAVPRTPYDIEPCATARGPLLPGPARPCSSSSHDDFRASFYPDFPSPSVSPGHCVHAAEPHNYDQSKCLTEFGKACVGARSSF